MKININSTLLEERTGRIKTIQYSELTAEQKENPCPICYDEYSDTDQIRVLKCVGNHIFHQLCISAWLDRNAVCPLCRTRIY